MNALVLLIVILLLFGGGVAPVWPHSQSWGYYPVGGIVSLVILLIVLRVFGLI